MADNDPDLERQLFQTCQSKDKIDSLQKILSSGKVNLNCMDERMKTPLHYATENNLKNVVKMLVFHSAEIDPKQGSSLETPLHIASRKGFFSIAQILLSYKASITAMNSEGFTPLFLAVKHNKRRLAEIILKQGIENMPDHRNYYDFCKQVIDGVHISDIDNFVKERTIDDVDFETFDGETPLQFAVVTNRPDLVTHLLKKGAKTDCSKVPNRDPVLFQAMNIDYNPIQTKANFINALFKRQQIMKNLLQHETDINQSNFCGRSLFEEAAFKGDLQWIELLLKNRAEIDRIGPNRRTPLNLAASSNQLGAVEVLLKMGANPNISDEEGIYPMHRCCFSANLELIKLFIEKGADPEVRDNFDQTVLHYASHNAHPEVLKYLLRELNIDPNSKDLNGNTPMHKTDKGTICCRNFSILLEHGGDVNLKNNMGQTPVLPSKCCIGNLCPFFMYLEKLRLLGYELNDTTVENGCDHSCNELMLNVGNYMAELKDMREIIISTSPKRVSLYDFVFMRRQKAARYAENEMLMYLARECSAKKRDGFQNHFPYYGSLLRLRYKQTLRRRKLQDEAHKSMVELLGIIIPYNHCEVIFEGFSNEELENFKPELHIPHFLGM